jgi:hypothetical protein
VVHLNGFDFSSDTSGSESNDHAGLDDTGLDTADRHRPNTTNLVNVLKGKTEGLVGRTGRRVDGVNGLKKGLASSLASLGLLLPALVPWAVGGVIDHVITVETRDRNESDSLRVIADLLNEVGGLLNDFLVTSLRPLSSVHLVDGDDELLDTKGVGKESVLTSLAILGDTSLELTSTGSNDKNSAIGLGSTSDHVLDEITVARGICLRMSGAKIPQQVDINKHTNDGDIVLGSLKLPESNIDGNTTLTLSLELVQNPCVLEGALAQLSGFLERTLVSCVNRSCPKRYEFVRDWSTEILIGWMQRIAEKSAGT